ncbi:hypothetical protein BS47DRAFT_1289466 [Hydnum rufescens UP504]|uniref:Uncharacterized protein n=1 Tax=Hydnum rufescens UP504 TaxID=1448309 RepID=A0A9P6B6J5_9AGAM|nr:hypothetical protein BS47DRAFT_1289466 [Hydnum rufescens UP504]
MSYRAKATLAAAIAFSSFTVWAMHSNQSAERDMRLLLTFRLPCRKYTAKRRQCEEELRQSLLKRERYETVQRVGPAAACNDGTWPESPAA